MKSPIRTEYAIEKARFQAQLQLKKQMHKGDPGYTPVKGKDYFTPREIAEFQKAILDMIPKPKDGKNAVVDYEKILRYTYKKVAEHVAALPTVKGDKGDKGEPGKDAVINMDALVRQVITALPKQKDKKLVIDKQQIIDLIEERVKKLPQQHVRIGGSVASIRALTDVNLDGLSQDEKGNYILGGGAASNITNLIAEGSNVTITGSGTLADPYVISASASPGSGISRSIVVTSGNTTMGSTASTDYVYFVAGAHTMSLPAASGNTNRYTVKNTHSANITIDTVGAENIEGAASIEIAPEESVDIFSNGTNWFVV